MTCFSRDVIKFSNQGLCLSLSLCHPHSWTAHWNSSGWDVSKSEGYAKRKLFLIWSVVAIYMKLQQTHTTKLLHLIQKQSKTDCFGADQCTIAIFKYALNEQEKHIRFWNKCSKWARSENDVSHWAGWKDSSLRTQTHTQREREYDR